MANFTPKISGAGLGILIEETPACTPVPQASSTAAHRNSDRYCICNPRVVTREKNSPTVAHACHKT